MRMVERGKSCGSGDPRYRGDMCETLIGHVIFSGTRGSRIYR